MDLEIALQFVNQILNNKVKRNLRPPEITVLSGTWQGITYEQMAQSSPYSANYLMRDIAPKFWKLLSTVLDKNIGKSNLKIQLCKLYDSSQIGLSGAGKLEGATQKSQQSWQSFTTLPSVFYGRNEELERAFGWATKDGCQLIKIWGLSGTGKTLLMRKIGEQLQQHYEVVIWRALATNQELNSLIIDLLREMGINPSSTVSLLTQLMEQMRSRRCLIMLDGVESLLQAQAFNGQYQDKHKDYQNLFQTVSSSSHQSCVITTSLENFGRTMLADSNKTIRELQLEGLSTTAARAIFDVDESIQLTAKAELIDYYQANPAILNFVAQIIRQLFNGSVTEFMTQKSMVFGEINHRLSKTFTRLSSLETEILYWLASESKAKSLLEIQNGIPLSIYPQELIEALESLSQRSLITVDRIENRSVFDLSPMIKEFVVNQFIATIGDNFSLANRQTSTLSQGTIELGNVTQTVHISQWLQNKFEPGWQPVETLFAASGRSPARLRSAFSLRGSEVFKRFKQIRLGTNNPVEVLLVVAISQLESAYKICVQVQPPLFDKTLPNNLKLSLIDPEDNVLANIIAEAKDNFIQLPYFSGSKNEKFTIGLSLGSSDRFEKFLI